MQELASQLEETREWEKRLDEPDLWYDRLDRFRLLGVTRSIRQLYRDEMQAAGKEPSERAPQVWYEISREWEWLTRCEAWDEYQREIRRREEAEARKQAQERNRTSLDHALGVVITALKAAKEGSDGQRLWIDTLLRLTLERRREFGYDVTRISEIDDADELIKVTLPGLRDD
jgi:hypothetical protein